MSTLSTFLFVDIVKLVT